MKLIQEKIGAGNIQGIRVAGQVRVTYLMFDEDLLIFGNGTTLEVKAYKELLAYSAP